jgi:hypothetical protein
MSEVWFSSLSCLGRDCYTGGQITWDRVTGSVIAFAQQQLSVGIKDCYET